MISTSTNFCTIGIKLVLAESGWNCYVVKLVLVEIGYAVLTSTNFAGPPTTFYESQFGVWGVMVSLGWSSTNSWQLSRLKFMEAQ